MSDARDVVARLESDRDQVESVRVALELYEDLRDVAEEVADARRRLIVAIVDSGAMTRRALAATLGVSERRIGALYQEAIKRRSAEADDA